MKTPTYLWPLVLVVCYSAPTFGNEAQDSQRQLLASCQALTAQPEPVTSSACIYYSQGFLAGVSATDTANATPQTERSPFMERAYRTRGGDNARVKQSARSNRYCSPNDESLTQVIYALSEPLAPPIETSETLQERIFHVLKAAYPCA